MGSAVVIRGDARSLPLPDASVDLICTSPPYFGLRSYSDGGVHFESQIGSEASPKEWLAALVECTREWVRVLKPPGSLFVNLGDKYAGGGGWSPDSPANQGKPRRNLAGRDTSGMPPKSLLGLPWRYALACTDELGLILRRDIIWSKPNGLPESVTDRCRSSHEYLFHLVRQPRYYAAVDENRTTVRRT
jgi:DNA modification methylase